METSDIVFIQGESWSEACLRELMRWQRLSGRDYCITAYLCGPEGCMLFERQQLCPELRDKLQSAGRLSMAEAAAAVLRQRWEDRRQEKTVFVFTGAEAGLLSDPELRRLMERGSRERGWEFVIMGQNVQLPELSEKLCLPGFTAVRYGCGEYGIRGAFRFCGSLLFGAAPATA